MFVHPAFELPRSEGLRGDVWAGCQGCLLTVIYERLRGEQRQVAVMQSDRERKKKKATVNTPNDGSHRNPLHLFTFSYDIEWEGVSFPGKTKGGQNSSHLSTALNPDCASESLQQEMIVEWCGCSRRCGQVFRLHQDVPTRIVFFCNTKLGLITKIPISGRDILPESILWSSWWRAAPMGGVSVSNSNPAPLLSTGPINVSAIRSAQLQNKEGRGGGDWHVNTKSKETQGDGGANVESRVCRWPKCKPLLLLTAGAWKQTVSARSNQSESSWFTLGLPRGHERVKKKKRSTEDKVEVYLCARHRRGQKGARVRLMCGRRVSILSLGMTCSSH